MKLIIAEAFELIRNGASIKQDKASGGIPITRIETIADGIIDYNRLGYAGINNDLYKDYYLQVGDILMSHINSEDHLGKVAIYTGDIKLIHGMNLLCLRPIKNVTNPLYAFFFFKSRQFRASIKRITKKSVNQASFNITSLEKLSIPLPDLPKQSRIAQILFQAETLIKQRKESIALLDEFLRSTFLKMFGMRNSYSSHDQIELIRDICQYRGGGTPSTKRNDYYNGNIPWVTPKDMKLMWVDNAEDKITPQAVEESSTVLIPKGAVLMVIRSGILKRKLPLAINEVDVAINQDMKALRSNVVLSEYLLYFFLTEERNILKKVKGTTADNLNFEDIKNLTIKVPPKPAQEKFSLIVRNVKKVSRLLEESLSEIENLYGSLSQRFFGASGEVEDKRYGDPFSVDEETAKAQGEWFYKEWRRLNDRNIQDDNLKKIMEYAVHPERIPIADKLDRIDWDGPHVEHFAYAGKKQSKKETFEDMAYEALDELLHKHPNGFSFAEFRTYLTESKKLDSYQETKEFVFDLLEKGELVQYFATPSYMRAAEDPLFNPPGGDNLRDALVWLMPAKTNVKT